MFLMQVINEGINTLMHSRWMDGWKDAYRMN